MLEKLKSILQGSCQLNPGSTVILGVSGGPDSLCLLDGLLRVGFQVVAAHYNHHLREEATEEARYVQLLVGQYAIPFVLGESDVAAFANQKGLSVEEAARTLRYTFLFEQARQFGVQAVAVGHTADDQVETILMHWLRGAGPEGLRGMETHSFPTAWSREIPLIRPLLSFWREQVLHYCQELGLRPLFDRSNLDTAFFRNRLRHELIPGLQSYNPRIKEILLRTARVLEDENRVLSEIAETAWSSCLVAQSEGYVSFHRELFREQPVGIQRRLLRRAIAQHRPGLRDVEFKDIERALEFISSPSKTGQRDLIAGLRLLVEGDLLWLATWEVNLPGFGWPRASLAPRQGRGAVLQAPGRLALPDGWELVAELHADTQWAYHEALTNTNPFQAWVDADRLQFPLWVGSRLPGDRFMPHGMDGRSIKLSDFMINVKMPRRARASWPLVGSGKDIVWVAGYRIGHTFRLTPATCRVLGLSLSRKSD